MSSTKQTQSGASTAQPKRFTMPESDPAAVFNRIQAKVLDKNLTQTTANIIRNHFEENIPYEEKEDFIYDLAQCFGMWVIKKGGERPIFNGRASGSQNAGRRQQKWEASVSKIHDFITACSEKKDVSWGSIKVAFSTELAITARSMCDNVYAPRFLAQSKVLTCLNVDQAQFIMNFRNNAALYVMKNLHVKSSFSNSSSGHVAITSLDIEYKDKKAKFFSYFDDHNETALASAAILDYTGLISYARGDASVNTLETKKKETFSLCLKILNRAEEDAKSKYTGAKKQAVLSAARGALSDRKRFLYAKRAFRPKGQSRANVSDSFDISTLDLDIDGDFETEDMSGLLEKDRSSVNSKGKEKADDEEGESTESNEDDTPDAPFTDAKPENKPTEGASPATDEAVIANQKKLLKEAKEIKKTNDLKKKRDEEVAKMEAEKAKAEEDRKKKELAHKAKVVAEVTKLYDSIKNENFLIIKDSLAIPYAQSGKEWDGKEEITVDNYGTFLNWAMANYSRKEDAKRLMYTAINRNHVFSTLVFSKMDPAPVPKAIKLGDLVVFARAASLFVLDKEEFKTTYEDVGKMLSKTVKDWVPVLRELLDDPTIAGLFDEFILKEIKAKL